MDKSLFKQVAEKLHPFCNHQKGPNSTRVEYLNTLWSRISSPFEMIGLLTQNLFSIIINKLSWDQGHSRSLMIVGFIHSKPSFEVCLGSLSSQHQWCSSFNHLIQTAPLNNPKNTKAWKYHQPSMVVAESCLGAFFAAGSTGELYKVDWMIFILPWTERLSTKKRTEQTRVCFLGQCLWASKKSNKHT